MANHVTTAVTTVRDTRTTLAYLHEPGILVANALNNVQQTTDVRCSCWLLLVLV
jgi:hypothetical protein